MEYLKDNPEGYWFKRKLYGWGWTPATWQGWLIILAFIVFIIKISFLLPENPSGTNLFYYFAEILLAVGLVIYICYRKGEKPRWQWGKRIEDPSDNK